METLILSTFDCTMTLISMIFKQVCRCVELFLASASASTYIFLNLFSESMYVDPKTLQL